MNHGIAAGILIIVSLAVYFVGIPYNADPLWLQQANLPIISDADYWLVKVVPMNYRLKTAPLLLSGASSITSTDSALLIVRDNFQEILQTAENIRYQDVSVKEAVSTAIPRLDYSEVEYRQWQSDEFWVSGNPILYVILVPLVPSSSEAVVQNGELYVFVNHVTCVETTSTNGATIQVYCVDTTVHTSQRAFDCGWLKLLVAENGAVYYGGMFASYELSITP